MIIYFLYDHIYMRTAYSNDGQMVMCQSVRIIKSNNKCPYHSDSALTTCPRQER
ncbi:hypothetical protein XELAEV_18020105mg [Xenopus laevis]|uniref:Uncharacterized protein n=1 Tax=Xenopus laevis TaxID=8355 RepID=A0A974D739_XENLA|nr:hypothetical protein XELAEV_18020105mg [Xenopus laevis]